MFIFQRDLTLKGNMRMIRMLWKLSSQLSHLFKRLLLCFQLLSHLPLLSATFPPLPTLLSDFFTFSHLALLSATLRGRIKPQQPGPAPHPLHDFQPFFHKLPTTPTNSSKESQRQLPAFHRFLQQLRRQLGMLVFSLNAGLSFQPKGHLEVTGVFITKIDIFPILAACIILFLNILTICSTFLTKSVQPAVTPCF